MVICKFSRIKGKNKLSELLDRCINQKSDKMEYRYKDIYLEEIIEEIFDDMNNENTIMNLQLSHYSIDLMRI